MEEPYPPPRSFNIASSILIKPSRNSELILENSSTLGTPQDLLEEIVKKLTKEILTEAIEAYGEDDGYWLKLHHFSDELFED